MGVENNETEYLEDPDYDIEDKEYLNIKPEGHHKNDYLTSI